MDIQKEWDLFVAHLRTLGVVKIGRNALGVITNLTREGNCSLGYNDIELMWKTWQVAKKQAIPEGFVLVLKEPSTELVNHGHDVFLGNFNEGGQTGGRSLYFAYKAMIEAQEPAPLKLGDLVKPIDHRYTLASGCERYPYAYVVNTNPFQLMSEEGDMYWCCTVEAGGYKLIKSNDQLPEAVSLRMIREGLLSPVEAQEQSHE